jgi:DNA polymerase III alpha subunit
MHELTPTFIANKGYATTHFDMDAVEAIGLVKMDILAQGGLAAMRDVKHSWRSAALKWTWNAVGAGKPMEPWAKTRTRRCGR